MGSSEPSMICRECGHALAHDQRYCVACGARRGTLPPSVAVAVGDIAAAHRPAPAPPTTSEPTSAHSPAARAGLAPLAGALAVCVLLMLGVGSVLGAVTTPGGITSLANTIVVSLSPSGGAAPTPVADAGGSGGGGAGGGGGGGGGQGAGATVAAPQAARTVTISATGGGGSQGGGSANGPTPTTPAPQSLPPIHHVWEIVLSGQSYQQSFGVTKGHPYLSRTLADQGTVISDYDAVATSPLANEIALVSGQGPTPQTLADCPQFSDLEPGRIGKNGQAIGRGCLYPVGTQTIGSELAIQGQQWRAYIQGIGERGQRHPTSSTSTTSSTPSTPSTSTTATSTTATAPGSPTTSSTTTSTPTTPSTTSSTSTSTSTSRSGTTAATAAPDTSTASGCPHPAEGATDATQAVSADDGYVTWKNPWVYFRSELTTTTCATDDVGLTRLARDLRSERTTPAFSYIAPDPCDDGSDTPCSPKAKSGLAQADRFLKSVVPEIERSPAYRDNGLILITFDEAPQSGPDWSTASCCGQPQYPNLPASAGTSGTSSTSGTTTSPTSATSTTSASTTSPSTTATGTTPGSTTTASTTTPGTSTSTSTASTTPGSTTSATTTSGSTTTSCTSTSSTTSSTTSTTTSTTSGAATTPCGPAITGSPPGGGQVGLLMISPYVRPAQINEIDVYNGFSLLKTVSKLLGVTPLGYAALADVPTLNPLLFLHSKR